MSRAGIELLLYLMDEAFEAQDLLGAHSLLANLATVRDDDWRWLPEGGGRSIFDIVEHVAACKFVYDSHAFGDGSIRFGRQGNIPPPGGDAPTDMIEWLKEGQRALRTSVASLDDDSELLRPRRAHWGQELETRRLINITIQHDLYHGGEINHIRALRQGDDR
jgi:hypothetical protein